MPKVAIAGLGLMGGSLGLALRAAGWSVAGYDRDAQAASRAVERGAIDSLAPSLAEPADVVVLALPVLAVESALAQIPRGPVVTDLCSTKEVVVQWAHQAGVDFVGGHPLCGSEQSGIEAASADLYRGAYWALTRADPVVEEMVVAAGARPLIVDPAEHDRLVAGSSHAAFAISTAYMLAASKAADWPAMAALAASGFRDMTRLAAGDPGMYAGIIATNAENLRGRLLEFQAALGGLIERLDAEPAEVERVFAAARAARLAWEESRRQ